MNAAVRSLPLVGTILVVIGGIVALVASRSVDVERITMDLTGEYGAPASQGWVSLGVIIVILGVGTLITYFVLRSKVAAKS